MTTEQQPSYPTEPPEGWVLARYETATHYLIAYLMEPGSAFRRRWESFCLKWEDAKGVEMRIKQQEARNIHQGFGDPKMREAVQRALQISKSRAAGTIDILRLDRILIAEDLTPLMALDARGFVAKTPGSKREETYRREGVPASITDSKEALAYILENGPTISETASTRARGNRDPRIKAQRAKSEWIRWIEVQAFHNLLAVFEEQLGTDVAEVDPAVILEALRQ